MWPHRPIPHTAVSIFIKTARHWMGRGKSSLCTSILTDDNKNLLQIMQISYQNLFCIHGFD